MRNILTVMKKEFDRFFKDKRMVLSTVILPGLMIYFVYSIMGSAMGSQFMTEEEYVYKMEVVNMPETMAAVFGDGTFEIAEVDSVDFDTLATRISDKELDVAVVFDEKFDAVANDVKSGSSQVEIYYNSTVTESSEAFGMVSSMIDYVETGIVDIIQVNTDPEKKYDLSTEEEMAGFLLSMIMPMLMVSFLFSGSMGVAPESIAGEKERGTMATLLVTPINRSHIAIGKIVSLSCIALLSGLSSFLGVVLALPKYMESVMGNVSMQVYGIKEYAVVLIVILATVLLIVSMISVISAYSKSVKEASSFISPIMIVSMLLGITTMFGGGNVQPLWVYLIPMYNSVQCFASIFSFELSMVPVLITFASNLLYAVALGFILTKMFGSEKIMFKK